MTKPSHISRRGHVHSAAHDHAAAKKQQFEQALEDIDEYGSYNSSCGPYIDRCVPWKIKPQPSIPPWSIFLQREQIRFFPTEH